jgi:hypothetical protein
MTSGRAPVWLSLLLVYCGGRTGTGSTAVDGGADAATGNSSSSSGGYADSGTDTTSIGSSSGGGPLDSGDDHLGIQDGSSSTGDAPIGDDGSMADGAVDGGLDGQNIFDSAIPDSSASPTEGFEIIFNGVAQTPLSCPSSHWEFSVPSTATVVLRNMGSVPLAYIAEPTGYIGGVQYTPGVPTNQQGEEVGVLDPGDIVSLTLGGVGGDTIALAGASKPFSIYDGGFAPADEWTIPWPMGVDGSGGSTTMYVADVEWDTSCSPVERQ